MAGNRGRGLQRGREQARHRKGVEQDQLVANFESPGFHDDAVAIQPDREQAGFTLLVGLEYRERRLDDLPSLVGDNTGQADQVTIGVTSDPSRVSGAESLARGVVECIEFLAKGESPH